MPPTRTYITLIACFLCPDVVAADVSYEREVVPILTSHLTDVHGNVATKLLA